MKVTLNKKQYFSGIINRKKYKDYCNLRNRLATQELYGEEDIDDMVKVIIEVFDNQFTEEDIDKYWDVSDIIFNFSAIDLSIAEKVNNKAAKVEKAFTKGKK